MSPAALYLGIDLGTSGVRASAIDAAGVAVDHAAVPLPPPQRDGPAIEQDPGLWWDAVLAVFRQLGARLDLGRIRRIAVDGTSGTLLLVDAAGEPVGPALMYNDGRAAAEARRIAALAPPESGAHGSSSALAKLLYLLPAERARARRALHQSDWVAGRLAGALGWSDENSALKLGYDPVARGWPRWLEALALPRGLLPEVVPPGRLVGTIAGDLARRLGLAPDVEIRAGTTDGIAAFIATRATAGEAVTSLGSTLVLKLPSERPVFGPRFGVYSHRFGEGYLVGGASNSGGAALLAQMSAERIAELTPLLDPERDSGLDYYPLPAPGERFPVADPQLAPRVTPRPADDAVFLQGLLEGIAAIEARGYALLAELGAPHPRRVLTVGGGARNAAWTRLRARRLGVPVSEAAETEAAYGTALLALAGAVPS
jgi:sugar (pentulose or hexulose) kinase